MCVFSTRSQGLAERHNVFTWDIALVQNRSHGWPFSYLIIGWLVRESCPFPTSLVMGWKGRTLNRKESPQDAWLNGGCSALNHKWLIVHRLWHLQQPLERDIAISPSGLIFKISNSGCLSEVGSDSSELSGRRYSSWSLILDLYFPGRRSQAQGKRWLTQNRSQLPWRYSFHGDSTS